MTSSTPALAMPQNDDLTLPLSKRAEALSDTLKTKDGVNLIQGYKRPPLPLAKAEAADWRGILLGAGCEIRRDSTRKWALFTASRYAEAAITPHWPSEDFATAMAAMAGCGAPHRRVPSTACK